MVHIAKPASHSRIKAAVAASWAMQTEKEISTRLNAGLRCAVTKKEDLKLVLTALIMVPVRYLTHFIIRRGISTINIDRQLNLSGKVDTQNLSRSLIAGKMLMENMNEMKMIGVEIE